MTLNVGKELAALERMSVGELRARYAELFAETTAARNRKWLIKRILWRMQSVEQGGLSDRAASTLADAVERVTVLATVQERLRVAERRLSEIDSELTRLDQNMVSDAEVARSLAEFDQVWQTLAPREQARILELLVERVDYDGERGQVSLTFRPCGIRSLTHELQESA